MPELSEYRGMWVFAMFDLPVDTKAARKAYAQFRKTLLREGFMMLQYSIYARYCASEDSGGIYRRRVRAILPDEGRVRLVTVTDHQFGKMECFDGRKRQAAEIPPPQLMLF